jgi:hemerythrin HHE cation binding domain-containing protein
VNLCPELRHFQAEHARWLAEIAERGPGAEAGDAARLLGLWEDEILPRCRRVEDVLLPELARRIPEADAVIVFTLGDHVVLRGLVRELRVAPEPGRREVAAKLGRKLLEHLAFEERTLFPAVQEALGCDRLAALGYELTIREQHRSAGEPPAIREAGRKKGKKP